MTDTTRKSEINKNSRRIFMTSGMLTFNPRKKKPVFNVGDTIKFYPEILINYYHSSREKGPCLQHIAFDIYKFRFKPIDRFPHDIHKNCYHYLIEISPDLKLFCLNWTKPYKSYLKVDQWYEGHGQLSNCGNAAEYNENISPIIMNDIYRTGKLTGIYENLLWHDYRNDKQPKKKPLKYKYSEDVYCYEDVLDGYGYSKNIDEFNKNIEKYKEKSIIYNSTDDMPTSANIIFCVDVLDQ